MRALQVIDQAFRTTVEEQDDTILWLTQSMVGAGADLQLLLSGHGVYYAAQTKRQPSLQFGDWQQAESAEIPRDIANLIDKGVPVFAVKEDLAARGLAELPLINGVEVVARESLADIYEGVDQVWHW